MIYGGCPGDNVIAILLIILSGGPALDQLARVAGNKMIADANIAGMTPAILILSGRKLLRVAYIFSPCIFLA